MYNLQVLTRFIAIVFLFICSLQASMASGYFPFIAENSGTKMARGTLNTVLGGGKSSRAESHRVYMISPFSRDIGLGEHNRNAMKARENFLAKNKTEAENTQEFIKLKYRIYEAASWDQGNDIKVLVTPSRETKKNLLDFNLFTEDGQILCQAKSVQRLPLTMDNIIYINLIHSYYGLYDSAINEEAILKTYDPACILDGRIHDMEVSLITHKNKPINVRLDTVNAGVLTNDVIDEIENLVVVD